VRIRVLFGVVLALALVVGIGLYVAFRGGDIELPDVRPRTCTVQADGRVTLGPTQMANAATIAAVGIRRGLPERAVVVALATAFQESKMENLSGGDRDSIGLFQQRPSQGWGTPQQIQDPRYATSMFYSSLVRVPGWQRMKVTEAAQAVQKSAHPGAYEQWADEATVLTKALLGKATGAVACVYPGNPPVRGTAAATALAKRLKLDWGEVRSVSGSVPGLTLAVRDNRAGWQYAHWLVAQSAQHGVMRVRFDSLEWTAKGGTWSKVDAEGGAAGERVVAEVYGDL
jgi:hypothetical protein